MQTVQTLVLHFGTVHITVSLINSYVQFFNLLTYHKNNVLYHIFYSIVFKLHYNQKSVILQIYDDLNKFKTSRKKVCYFTRLIHIGPFGAQRVVVLMRCQCTFIQEIFPRVIYVLPTSIGNQIQIQLSTTLLAFIV